jgi:hypothetical protein
MDGTDLCAYRAEHGRYSAHFLLSCPFRLDLISGFFIVCMASIAYLVNRNPKWDLLAASSAEIGVLFITLVLITGPCGPNRDGTPIGPGMPD